MSSRRKRFVSVLVAIGALAGIAVLCFLALSAIAAELGQELVKAVVSIEGIVYGLRAIVFAALVVLVLQFLIQAREQ